MVRGYEKEVGSRCENSILVRWSGMRYGCLQEMRKGTGNGEGLLVVGLVAYRSDA